MYKIYICCYRTLFLCDLFHPFLKRWIFLAVSYIPVAETASVFSAVG